MPGNLRVCVCVFHSVGTTFHQMRTRHVGWPGNKFLARLPSRLLAEGHLWRHNLICWLSSSSSSLPRSCFFCLSCPSHLCATYTPHEQTKSRANDTQADRSLPNPFLQKNHLLGSAPPKPPPTPMPDVSVWLCGHCCMRLLTLQTTTALIGRFVFSYWKPCVLFQSRLATTELNASIFCCTKSVFSSSEKQSAGYFSHSALPLFLNPHANAFLVRSLSEFVRNKPASVNSGAQLKV